MSAGSIAAASTFAGTYREPRHDSGEAPATEDIVFDTPGGGLRMILVKAQGVGPTYTIDDQTAFKVTDGNVEVVSEGHWRLFSP